ncbi:MAG: hypothetical protein MPN21_00720 [Thermoanaerobaculia bacterium]|nr:hypothetical protein [Thermoanaerobaculia bacterium]
MADQDLWRKNLPEDWQGKMADEWDGEIPLKPIFWSTFAVALSVFIAFVLNIWLMEAWDGYRASKVRVSPLAEAQERFEHVDPKLQASPEAELIEMQEQQEEQLASYGWIDPIDRRVHIPVERAMEIVLDEKTSAVAETIEPVEDAPVDVGAAADQESEPAAADHGDAGDH